MKIKNRKTLKTHKEKRGDWPIELAVVDEADAVLLDHDVPPQPTREQEEEHRRQMADEARQGHPSDKWRVDDPDLD